MDGSNSQAEQHSSKNKDKERDKRYAQAARERRKSATTLPKTIVAGMIASLTPKELQS